MSVRIHAPRRAPRLPRDHFAALPELTKAQRVARAIIIGIVVIYFVALHFYGHE